MYRVSYRWLPRRWARVSAVTGEGAKDTNLEVPSEYEEQLIFCESHRALEWGTKRDFGVSSLEILKNCLDANLCNLL